MENEIVRTSIYFDKELHKKIKLYCIQNGISLKEFVIQAVKEKLEK